MPFPSRRHRRGRIRDAGVVAVSAWEDIQAFVGPGTPFYDDMVELRGTADDNPEFWADVSPLTFVERVTRQLLVLQGTADDVVPPHFADTIATAWTDAGNDVELVMVAGADHFFAPHEDEAWAAVFTFLEERLGSVRSTTASSSAVPRLERESGPRPGGQPHDQ